MANIAQQVDFTSGIKLKTELLDHYRDLNSKPVGPGIWLTAVAKELCVAILSHMLAHPVESMESGSTAEKVNLVRKVMKQGTTDSGRLFTQELDVMAVVDINHLVSNASFEVNEAGTTPSFITLKVDPAALTNKELSYTSSKDETATFLSPVMFMEFIERSFRRQYDNLKEIVSNAQFERYKDSIKAIEPHGAAIMLRISPNNHQSGTGMGIIFDAISLLQAGCDSLSVIDNISLNEALVDLVPAIRIPEWPLAAAGWISRPRLWPPQSLVDEIVSQGVMVVCKAGVNGNVNTDWRLSFSKAEIILISDRNHPARQQGLRILKFMIKYLISPPSILTSYHCKTVFLWACERLPPSFWIWDNLNRCVLGLLDDLIAAAAMKSLPHYFIQGVNLLENVSDDILQTVGQKLVSLRRNPGSIQDAYSLPMSEDAALEMNGIGKSSQMGYSMSWVERGNGREDEEIDFSPLKFLFYLEDHDNDESLDRFEIMLKLLELKYGYTEDMIERIRKCRAGDIENAKREGRRYERPFIPKQEIFKPDNSL